MTPTLPGRWQTRVALLWTIGLALTALVHRWQSRANEIELAPFGYRRKPWPQKRRSLSRK